MAFQTERNTMTGASAELAQVDVGLRQYMLGVYNYMASGVALTGLVALLVANTSLQRLFYVQTAHGPQPSILTWGAMLVSIGIVFFLSFRVAKMSAPAVQGTFWAYATLNGIWLSSIFMVYTDASIARVFFITAASFAGLSLYGYTTRRDLTAMGSFMMMGLIGILIASLVNMFLASSALDFAVSVIGVIVFAGLTAYDTQKVKEMYWEADGHDVVAKTSVMGALTLYLDFINLFLMLLRFFGDRR
ncbi:MAG: Bax inhibitor-1/YccA family protein [Alphaproteobacteria bacterium]